MKNMVEDWLEQHKIPHHVREAVNYLETIRCEDGRIQLIPGDIKVSGVFSGGILMASEPDAERLLIAWLHLTSVLFDEVHML